MDRIAEGGGDVKGGREESVKSCRSCGRAFTPARAYYHTCPTCYRRDRPVVAHPLGRYGPGWWVAGVGLVMLLGLAAAVAEWVAGLMGF